MPVAGQVIMLLSVRVRKNGSNNKTIKITHDNNNHYRKSQANLA